MFSFRDLPRPSDGSPLSDVKLLPPLNIVEDDVRWFLGAFEKVMTGLQKFPGPAWDVLQATAEGNQQALICAYQTNDGVSKITVKPVGLDSVQTYQVWSVDSGALGKATGAELMSGGIDIQQSPNTAAHILIIRVQP